MNEKNVLRSINLHWRQGESIALIGANGAGKSSLLKVLSTLVKPSSGNIKYPVGISIRQWKESLGIVFPETFLYDGLTGYENLQFYQKLYGKVDKDGISQVLEQVELSQVQHELVSSYSKGMKQRLSIARALVHYPTYFLLDEPFDGLDLVSKQVLEDLLQQMHKKGTSYILVSHDTEHAWKLCDRALLMHKGRIVLEEKCTREGYLRFTNLYNALFKENQHDIS
ncbi:ABC transporter ATP-binding protein [Halobacillus amylolyticus]|uniref:ABC transporter ATP-binding protein n=1 Tax=Halobacillus amylolyticus TaxID=2932259 RepID=A0ABY4HG36_9BACI|nr:ABC transporter ATP-binding protein [Halobacillus amylolyticus]UOR13867.1 ABC transporter ATP-binding protein [Halobacillus amylolyticus]